MRKKTKVVIVGFPNTGKSTLFNRLLKMKKSLVHSLPGMTRDGVSGICRIGERRFELVDTGGFFEEKNDPISSLVLEKAWGAAADADLILFLLDGKRGILPAEEDLYFSLKKRDRPILVVVNKIDSPAEEDKLGEFFRLGQEMIYAISAEHKRNLDELEEAVEAALPEVEAEEKEEASLKIAVVGRINVGKSSIVNRLCGEERQIVSEMPGTTRDSVDTLIRRNKKAYTLVDTAGIRKMGRTKDKREKAGVIKAKKDITRADVICMVLDAQEFPTRQDTAIAHLARDSGKPLLLALNKWDLVEKGTETAAFCRERLAQKLDFVSYAPVVFISALSGKRTVKILDLADQVFAGGSREISTSRLNEFLAWIHASHPPLSVKKGKMKIKYMVQKGKLPPTFILFTHSRSSLSPLYEKHFVSLLRERFGLSGTPIRIILRRN